MRKVDEKELKEIEELRQTLFEIISATGELTLSKYVLENQLKELTTEIESQQKRFAEFQSKERVLFEQLQQKYGTGNINIETGEISE